jgi:hypothetical protein
MSFHDQLYGGGMSGSAARTHSDPDKTYLIAERSETWLSCNYFDCYA